MVCPRCIESVKGILQNANIEFCHIGLGVVETKKPIDNEQKKHLAKLLTEKGFELLSDKKQKTINQIKALIVQQVHYNNEQLLYNFSDLISSELKQDYSTLSRLFSSVEGITIEKYIMAQKIEKVKELLSYNEMKLSEIAEMMNYSSVSHLSTQFKKVTGMSPTAFLKNIPKRKPLNEL